MTKNDPEGERERERARAGYMGNRDPQMYMLKSKSGLGGGVGYTNDSLPSACSNQRPWSPKTARQKQIEER